MQRAVGLRAALEVAQHDLGLVGRLRYRDNVGETLGDGLLARLGNLVIALVGLCDATKLVHRDLANLAHLVAQIDCGKMVRPILR
jgi:hypothetical protein